MKKISVLHIGIACEKGGIESFIVNVCSHLDQSRYLLSIIADCKNSPVEQELKQIGGKVLHIPSAVEDKIGYIKGLWTIIDKNRYDVVHIHKNSLANPVAIYICYLKGIKKIILHSHNTQPTNANSNVKVHEVFKKMTAKIPMIRLACSKQAAEWMYPENVTYEILHNGIQTAQYQLDSQKRQKKRHELGIENDMTAFCAIGRLTKQKNPIFLVDIFTQIRKRKENCRLYFVGNGVMAHEVKLYAKKSEFYKDIYFLGTRNDIPDLLQAFDLLLMPSLYEGLPIAAIEAQAAGLPLLISDNVDKDVKLTPFTEYESIEKSPEIWAEHTLELKKSERNNSTDLIVKSGYDIMNTVVKIQQIYSE